MKKNYSFMIIIFLFMFFILIDNVSAESFNYNPTYFYFRYNNSWHSVNATNSTIGSLNTYHLISPSNDTDGVLLEYGLPNGEGTLSFSISYYSELTKVPEVYVTVDNNIYTCNNNGIPTWNTNGRYNVSYFCPGYKKSTNAYNSLLFMYTLSESRPIYFDVFKFVVINDNNVSSINELNSINSSINNQSAQQHQDAQDIKNNTKETNDLIKNDNVDSSTTSSSTSSWANKNATNGVITQLLTLPITLLQAIVNGVQTSCTTFNLGTLWGTTIEMPCINLSSLIGISLFNVIDLLFSGFMIYAISKKLIKIFNDFTNLKSNQIDELYGGGNQ